MEQSDEQSKLRKYILNDIGSDERSEIEERLLADTEYFEEVLMAEDSLIQDYADKSLDAASREKFENHFLSSEENRQKVQFARALRKYVNENQTEPEAEKKPVFFDALKAFFAAPYGIGLAVLLIVAVVGFIIWKNVSQPSEVLIALNRFQSKNRPTQARISGFDYAPKTEGTRGNNKDGNLDLVSAKSSAAKAVLKNETAENLHELGLVYLAENDYEEAIRQLEKAVKKNPDIAKIHNDLGAAFLEKAKLREEGRLENTGRASEEFSRAIELDKKLLEAYFNRALCIQALNLPYEAKEAWEKYLELDNNSPWAEEARKNLEAIEKNKPITKNKEDVLREFIEAEQISDHEKAWQILSTNRELLIGKLIPQQLAFLFVDAKTTGDESNAGKVLESLTYAAHLETERADDRYWENAVSYYSDIEAGSLPLLKNAQDLFREGDKLRASYKYQDSLNNFEAAKQIFVKIQHPTAVMLCDYWIGVNLYQLNQIDQSNIIFEKLIKLSEPAGYKWLAVISYLRLAYSSGARNDHEKAIAYSKSALEYIERINDIYDKQRALTIIANKQKDLGQYKMSLNYSEKNFELSRQTDINLIQKWRDYETVTAAFQGLGLYSTATVFQQEALKLTRLNGDYHNEQVSNVYLARIHLQQGKFAAANKFINESIRIAANLADEEARKKALAYSKLLQGNLMRLEGKYQEAVAVLDEVAAFYDKSEFQLWRYNTHREKFLSYLEIKDDQEITAELTTILEIFRFHRNKILEDQKRNSFFENKQDVYDLAINYEFNRQRFDAAFDYSEESRARSLLDLQNSVINISFDNKQPEIKFSTNITEPLKFAQIQAEIPENVQLVQYSVLNDKVLIWLITKQDLSVGKTEISADALQEKILTYVGLLSKNAVSDEQKNLSAELYNILINPIKEKLDTQKELFLIPDKWLTQLPFATLYSEKYLIEDYKISYAPSANVFLFCTRRAKELGLDDPEQLLAIGNPTFNSSRLRDLQTLPSAKKEVEEISKFYKNPIVLTEKDATKERFRENLKKAEIIHFAGHYVVDENSPMRSGLVLTGKDENSNLANYEILGEKLSHIRLIILSACQTGGEQLSAGEGMIGASRAFLAAGVPLSVVSQWEVDSTATAKLMVDFHRFRKEKNYSTAEALRQAQIDMLRSEQYQAPYFWAAFINLGGYSKF